MFSHFFLWFNVLKACKTLFHSGSIHFISITCVQELTFLVCKQQLRLSVFDACVLLRLQSYCTVI